MLLKCIAIGRCCPKPPEEELCADPSSNGGKLYCNPYMLEGLTGQPYNIGEGDNFPPGANALMYNHGTDAQEAESDEGSLPDVGEDIGQDGVGIPQSFRVRAGSASPSRPRVASPGRGEITPGGSLVSTNRGNSSPSREGIGAPNGAAPGAPHDGLHGHGVGFETCHRPPPSGAGRGASAFWGSSIPSRSSTSPGQQSQVPFGSGTPIPMIPGGPVIMGDDGGFRDHRAQTPFRSFDGSNVQRQPVYKDGDRSASWAPIDFPVPGEGYGSNIGASSISVIQNCILKAKGLPEQQKPNSEKWTSRWETGNFSHLRGV